MINRIINTKPKIIYNSNGYPDFSSPYIKYRKFLRNKIFNYCINSNDSLETRKNKILKFRPQFPISACFNIHNYCNLKCYMCTYSSKKREIMEIDLFRELLNQFYNLGGRIFTFNNFSDVFALQRIDKYLAISSNFFDKMQLYFVTNGVGLNKKQVDNLFNIGFDGKICISCHGFTKSTYKKTTGKDLFELVFSNINYLIKKHPNPRNIVIRFNTDFADNEEINNARDYWNKKNVYFEPFTSHTFAGNCNHKKILNNDISALRGCNGGYDAGLLFTQIIIEPNGDIGLCCMDTLRSQIIGSAKQYNIYNVWNSDKFKNIISSVYCGIKTEEKLICTRCENAIIKKYDI